MGQLAPRQPVGSDAGQRVQKADVVVIDIDFAAESVGEARHLDFARGAVFFGPGQLVGEPEHAGPEAGGPAGVATRWIVFPRATNGISAVLGGVVRVNVGKGDQVAVDSFESGGDGCVEVHSLTAPMRAPLTKYFCRNG